MDEYKGDHPWGVFLEARKKAITWVKEEMNRCDKEIAITLSMDEVQVFLIRTNTEKDIQSFIKNIEKTIKDCNEELDNV